MSRVYRPVLTTPFIQRIQTVFGAPGRTWLSRLPIIISAACRRWQLTLEAPFPGLSYNFAAPGRRADGTPVVLKAGVPRRELATEIAALRHFDGRGAVRLLAADAGAGLLLLERLLPGTMLATLPDDDEATRIAARLLRRLWASPPAGHAFPAAADWFAGIHRQRAAHAGGSGPLPEPLLARAEAVYAELCASRQPPVLLHGDFHHFNVLAAGRAPWLVIDPKGVVGEAGLDVGPFLANPWGKPISRRMLARRLDILSAELDLSRERLRGWGLAHAMLSACWSVEDGEDPAQALGVARALAALA